MGPENKMMYNWYTEKNAACERDVLLFYARMKDRQAMATTQFIRSLSNVGLSDVEVEDDKSKCIFLFEVFGRRFL